MSVDDYGLEALRKSAEQIVEGNKSEYRLKTNVTTSALPTGASTAANQATANTSLNSIDSKLTSPVTVKYSPYSLDAFARLRVSNPQTVFEFGFIKDLRTKLFTEFTQTGASSSHNSNKTSVDFATNTTSGSKIVFQTLRYFNYHPGKSQLLILTGNLQGKQTNVRKRVGQFDDNNGVFFELDGQSANVCFRSKVTGSVVDTKVEQASWNIDKLNGSGASGVTLDFTKQQILFVDFQWLGSGVIRFGTIIGGNLIYAHQFNNANVLDSPWSQYSIWPIRCELENTGTPSSNGAATLACGTLISEGGWGPEGILQTANNGVTPRALSAGATVPLLTIRKASASVKLPIVPIDFSALSDTPDNYLIQIIRNGTLTGASFSALGLISEVDVSATAITGGDVLYSKYLGSGTTAGGAIDISALKEALNLIAGASFNGGTDAFTSSHISIVATTISGAANIFCSINFKELV